MEKPAGTADVRFAEVIGAAVSICVIGSTDGVTMAARMTAPTIAKRHQRHSVRDRTMPIQASPMMTNGVSNTRPVTSMRRVVKET